MVSELQNTRQMSTAPEMVDDYAALDDPTESHQPVTLYPVFTGEAFRAAVAYPVIVECWERCKHGRGKRAWLAEFTEQERTVISRYHAKFYRWHLVTGTPLRVACKLFTLHLLQRAVAFFSQI